VHVSDSPDLRSHGTLSLGFGLVGALAAYAIMRMAETDWLDRVAFYAGIAAAAIFGAASAWGVQRLSKEPRFRAARIFLVPLAGALVGMMVQAILLREPTTYAGTPVGLTKTDPVTWILVGAPLGAAPAILVGILLHVALRLSGRVPPLDARERMLLPVAGTCLVFAAAMIRFARGTDVPALAVVGLFAAGTLVQTALRDRARARWLDAVFAGHGSHGVVPIADVASVSDLPAFVSGAPLEGAIVRFHGETGYRAISRTAIATTAMATSAAIRPLKTRGAVVLGLFATAAVVFAVGQLV
jgi:hypothetical protein